MANSEMSTRDRILSAAMIRFSNDSYEDTGLRDIARDAEVDVAYVHRSFGSKQALFAEALKEAIGNAKLRDRDCGDFGDQLAALVLEQGDNRRQSGRAFDIMVHSMSSCEARPVLREALAQDFIGPLLERFPGVGREEIALATAILVGMGICGRVLQLDLFRSGDEAADRALLAEQLRDLFRDHPDG